MTIFHYKNVRMLTTPNSVAIIGMDFIQISIVHDRNCELIHKKCHEESYHIDIKYHMTLNTICSVVAFIALMGWVDIVFSFFLFLKGG